jgi:hypothetical protein
MLQLFFIICHLIASSNSVFAANPKKTSNIAVNKDKVIDANINFEKKNSTQIQSDVDKVKNNNNPNQVENNIIKVFNTKEFLNTINFTKKKSNIQILETDSIIELIKQILGGQLNQKIQIPERQTKVTSFSMPGYCVLSSLMYFDNANWTARINGYIVNHNSHTKISDNVAIIKVDKRSALFLLLTSKKTTLERVNAIKDANLSYSSNYHVVSFEGNQFVAFRLYPGQKINLYTMLISDL